jgi:hypothetical protein
MPYRNYPKPDYGHLYGKAPEFILDAALQNRTYGHGVKNYEAEVNLVILKLYGDRTILTLDDMLEMVETVRAPRNWSVGFTLDFMGNAIAWGIFLGIVERIGEDRSERSFRLLHREPVFDIVAGDAMRVIGLPPDEQIAMNARRSRLRRLHATLAIKRSIKVRKAAEPLIDRMITADRDAKIPDEFRTYLDAQFFELSEEMSVRHLREYLLEAPDAWDAYLQKHWLRSLAKAAEDAERRAQARRELEAEAAATEVVLPEDIDAFAGI